MKYKLVPVVPTQEMIDEGRTARTHPRERYKAMLAAAPDVEQEPVAWIVNHPRFCGKFTDDKKIAEYWENEEQGCTAPLFLHPQQAPEIAKLVESLEVAHRLIANGIELGYIQMPDSDTLDPAHETLPAIEAALAEYRAQGGDL